MNDTLRDRGDDVERESWDDLQLTFPNYERFWQQYIVPLSLRPDGINWKPRIHPLQKKLCLTHYSVFYHLARAHQLMRVTPPEFFEGVFAYLASAIENVRSFSSVLICVHVELKMTTPKIVYHEAVQKLLGSTRLTSEEHSHVENCLNSLYGREAHRKNWTRFKGTSEQIRAYRNRFVHAPKGISFVRNHLVMVPTWKHFREYHWEKLDEHIDCRMNSQHFVPVSDKINELQEKLERQINTLWEIPLNLMKEMSDQPLYKDWSAGISFPGDRADKNSGFSFTPTGGTANWPEHPKGGTSYGTEPLE
jgi:hypothetical protein